MLSFNDFEEVIKLKIKEYLSEEYKNAEVEVIEHTKNNGVKFISLTVKKADTRIAPIIKLEEMYKRYLEDSNMERTLIEIANIIEVNDGDEMLAYADKALDFDKIAHKIFPRLINYDLNKECLDNRPHKLWNDLVICYAINVKEDENGAATAVVTNALMQNWGITIEELNDIAMYNMQSDCKYSCRGMFSVVAEMSGIDMEDMFGETEDQMYVVTNGKSTYGAAIMLDTGYMEELRSRFGDFTILPSSVHEIIVIPDKFVSKDMNFREMIQTVNSQEVPNADILSNRPYHFDGESVDAI